MGGQICLFSFSSSWGSLTPCRGHRKRGIAHHAYGGFLSFFVQRLGFAAGLGGCIYTVLRGKTRHRFRVMFIARLALNCKGVYENLNPHLEHHASTVLRSF